MAERRKSVGIHIENSSDVTLVRNRIVGADVGIHVNGVDGVRTIENVIVSPEQARKSLEQFREALAAAKLENPDLDTSEISDVVDLVATNPRAPGLASRLSDAIRSSEPYVSLVASLVEIGHAFQLF